MPAAAPTRYLPALDGLRAVSVLLVLGFHADVAGMQGGFLGVEMFFVVSGYLITSLLLGELEQRGRVSLAAFWGRRARRLLPALFCVIAACLLLSRGLGPGLFAQTQSDALAALFYVSNWWQVIHRHSYFMDVDRPPLLLHLWSLAVEEQFYLGWPLALALIGRVRRHWLLPLALLGAALSAGLMAWRFDPSLDPTRVYVGTDTRLSGVLLGAALAAWQPFTTQSRPARGPLREGAGLVGLAALAWLVLRLSSHDAGLYRGGLVLVDLATCALLLSLSAPTRLAGVFGSAPLAWLGRRSYGLYLWHWPVFALTRPELDLDWSATSISGLRLGLTFVLAELCYRFVEQPIREARSWTRAAATAFAIAGVVVAAHRLTPSAQADPSPPTLALALTPTASAISAEIAARAPEPALVRPSPGVALDPAWPKTLTVLSDSVGLALTRSLPAALPDWRVEVLGRPALMVKQAVPEFLNARAVGSVVIVALAYNSLFEKDRQNYARWSGIWDRSAERLLSDLKACGAKKIVWVTLREASPELVDDSGRDQYERYAWFFPYANERIRALASRHPELALADWQAVSNVPGLTRDLIHLNPAGVERMTRVITQAVLLPAPDSGERATP